MGTPKLPLVYLTFSIFCCPQQVARLLEGVRMSELPQGLLRDSSGTAVGGVVAGPGKEEAELSSAATCSELKEGIRPENSAKRWCGETPRFGV